MEQIIEPRIKPTQISIPDRVGNETQSPKLDRPPENFAGRAYPLIKIGSTLISQFDIQYFSLTIGESFLPEISLSFADQAGVISELDMPLDGDFVSIRIVSPENNLYEDIKLDCDIISIQKNDLTINAQLVPRIPNLYIEKIESYGSKTSFETLKEVAEKNSLGFVSNVGSTNDKMLRVRNKTLIDFIRSVTECAYKDQDSFFSVVMDAYNNIVFVDLNKQFSLKEEYEQTNIIHNMQSSFENETPNTLHDFILTNSRQRQGSNVFIHNHRFINETSDIWQNEGYFKQLKYYKEEDKEFLTTKIEPTFDKTKNYIPTRGNLDSNENLNVGRSVFKGILREGNHHDKYYEAIIQNQVNLAEVSKLGIEIELLSLNLGMYIYQKIPIKIYTYSQILKDQLHERDNVLGEGGDNDRKNVETDSSFVENKFLSGFYVVRSIQYFYEEDGINRGNIRQKALLSRREFPIPPRYEKLNK